MAEERDFRLRPFQELVLKHVINKRNVILQAPTGAGKTRAALIPFLQNLAHQGNDLPLTCRYAVPMRVLANQFYREYHSIAAAIDSTAPTRLVDRYQQIGRQPISIQTGEQPDDPQFESALTFCTIDQLLASFLGVPYSVDGRKANINVAAVAGSYLVLDEFHLYPLVQEGKSCFGARTTAIAMLRLLKSVTRFILMTATFSQTLLNELKELLDAEIVTVDDDEELSLIASGRERVFEVSSSPMDVEAILATHDSCSMVTCNTVLRAQQMYWKLREQAKERGIELILLHSRLTAADRGDRSARVMHELGQVLKEWEGGTRYGWKNGKYYGKNLIVIATQVVEVGLDISVQVLHTELAPANSLVQRAGRCARFARQKGQVVIYPLLDEEGKELSCKPYDKPLCDATWAALQNIRGRVIGFKEEQDLINDVHTEEDRSLLERYRSNHGHIAGDIFTNLNEQNRSIVSKLIREVEQVHILIHDDPGAVITREPWRWQSFALHPDSLAGRWKALQEKAAALNLDWVCKKAIALPKGDDEADNTQKTTYIWDSLPASGDARVIARTLREALMVVLPTQLATYHEELGFMLLDESIPLGTTGYQSTPPGEKKKKPTYDALKQQHYFGHISGLVNAYNRGIRQNMHYVISRLETLLNVPAGTVDQAIRLAIACHDLGKLGEQWQQWAWDWQTQLFSKQGWPALPQQPFFFAKTDFDYSLADHQKWRNEMVQKRPPHHACESVALGMKLIRGSLEAQLDEQKARLFSRAINAAVAHHHTTSAHEYESVRLKPGAEAAVKEALERAREQEPWTYDLALLERSYIKGDDLQPMNLSPSLATLTRPSQGRLNELETWLYFVIVRALRLADQRADKLE